VGAAGKASRAWADLRRPCCAEPGAHRVDLGPPRFNYRQDLLDVGGAHLLRGRGRRVASASGA
jgi:hypothetical protein